MFFFVSVIWILFLKLVYCLFWILFVLDLDLVSVICFLVQDLVSCSGSCAGKKMLYYLSCFCHLVDVSCSGCLLVKKCYAVVWVVSCFFIIMFFVSCSVISILF
ncbi:hypothetical protein Dimus_023021 [Dionaea muscipula]